MKGWGKKILVIVVLLAAAGYTGLWFHYASNAKSQAKEVIAQIQDAKVSGPVPEVDLGDISVSGFPLHFNIAIAHVGFKLTPEMLKAMQRQDVPMSGMRMNEPVRVELDVFGKDIRLVIPAKLTITGEEGKLPMVVQLNEDAVLRVSLTKSPAEFFLTSGNPVPWDKQRIVDHFREFSFVNSGGRALLGDKPLSANGPAKINLSHTSLGEGNNQIVAKFSIEGIQTLADDATIALYADYGMPEQKEFIQFIFEHARSGGSGSMRLDADFTGPLDGAGLQQKDSQLVLNELSFANNLHALKLSGKVQKTAADPMPVGSISIQVANYPALIDYYFRYAEYMTKSMNTAMLKAGQPMPPFAPALESLAPIRDAVMAILQAAGEVSGDHAQNVALYLRRDAGGEFYIGKLTVPQVMQLFMERTTPQGAVPPVPLEPGKVN